VALAAGTCEPRRQGDASARLAVAAALLSAGAGAIHAAAAGPHFEEYAPFGIAFAATALLQWAWAVGTLVAPSRHLLAAGVVGNAGVVAGWALSRTAGLPVGPDAWTPEPLTVLDGAATAFEFGIVAACAVLLVSRASELVPLRARRFAAAAAIAAVALTAVPIAVARGGHSHDHGDAAATHAAHGHAGSQRPPAAARPRADRTHALRPKRRSTRAPHRAAAQQPHDHESHDHAHP
jgi:hypothetical protein